MAKASGTIAVVTDAAIGISKNLENYQFKVDIMHDGSFHASVGVVFRYQDAKNYYRVIVTSWCTYKMIAVLYSPCLFTIK